MSSPFRATYPTGGIPVEGVGILPPPEGKATDLCVDIPAAAVLLVVYLGLGLVHAFFFFRLSKRTFVPQAMVMGFCFSRVVSMSLRIAWSTNLTNKNIAIASSVFISAGVLLLV
jgi:hypothetical protein